MSKLTATTTVAKTFVKQFVAFVNGDDAEVKAAGAHRQALAAVSSSISQLEGDLVDKEITLTDKIEARAAARVNSGEPIKDRPKYVSNLIQAHDAVKAAEEALANHIETIAFLKAELVELGA